MSFGKEHSFAPVEAGRAVEVLEHLFLGIGFLLPSFSFWKQLNPMVLVMKHSLCCDTRRHKFSVTKHLERDSNGSPRLNLGHILHWRLTMFVAPSVAHSADNYSPRFIINSIQWLLLVATRNMRRWTMNMLCITININVIATRELKCST